jgi:hypothetical protein
VIEEQNPWWFHEPDPDMESFEKLKFKIVPEWIKNISLEPFSLNFIVGPRRVGKTMGLKLLINSLIGKNPYSIFYFSCDLLEDYEDLIEIIKEYIQIRERKDIAASFIFLDEITFVKDWWRAVKYIIDRGYLKNDILTITGSVSLDIGKHVETFAGRMGGGRRLEITPLSFRDYYHLFYQEFFEEKGEEVFDRYLETGGYLAFLNGELKVEEHISLIKSDIKYFDRSTGMAREIIGVLIDKAPSPTSFNSIAGEIGVSTNTVRKYIELFEGLHILLQIPFMGGDGKIYPRKERKLAIRDPLLARSHAIWAKRGIKKDVLYEWVVQEHLYRKFGEVYYYRNRYEIDAISDDVKVEVKSGRAKGRYPGDVKVLSGKDVPKFLYEILTGGEKHG